MAICIIFGGTGYIGNKLTQYFLDTKTFTTIYIVDINESTLKETDGVIFSFGDVRKPIPSGFIHHPIDWIFNLAAVHREPGHEKDEYFQTNILGAEHVCNLAEKIGCRNIVFTSSISVYGPTLNATDEYTLTTPNTPYGISKLSAEYIHKEWAAKSKDHKLVIVRPGVIYGPGDPGNILRMIKAIKRGYFFLPVKGSIKKSYGYIYGLIDSILFMMKDPERVITYNYVEKETETLGDMIKIINSTLNFQGKTIRIPLSLLKLAARVIHTINPNINGIHPERVKKVARPTHIVPKVLIEKGFTFKYDFKQSLIHWKQINNEDFS